MEINSTASEPHIQSKFPCGHVYCYLDHDRCISPDPLCVPTTAQVHQNPGAHVYASVLCATAWVFVSVQFSHSVMSNSLQPHGLQHARLPCP